MRHIFIDREGRPLPSWQEAMPEAACLRHEQLAAGVPPHPGILWCRVRSGESIAAELARVPRSAGQRLVVLSDEPDEGVVMAALAAGAAGCCNSRAAPEVLRQVALVVANGGLWVGQSLLQKLVAGSSALLGARPPEGASGDWAGRLSERESEVARRVAAGASNKEIAESLDISERTVKAHLTAIFAKLGVRDRLQLSVTVNGVAL